MRKRSFSRKVEKKRFAVEPCCLWYYRQVGGQTQDTLRHDLKALEKIPLLILSRWDRPMQVRCKAMELPFIMAVRNRHITEEDLKTALRSRMQGNAEQFLLAQPNITNMIFEKIITLCQQRFYTSPKIKPQPAQKIPTTNWPCRWHM
jgi:hypothetical protein